MSDSTEKTILDAWTISADAPGPNGEKSTTVVFVDAGSLDKKWMERVSKYQKDARTIFLEVLEGGFRPNPYFKGSAEKVVKNDLEASVAAARSQGLELDAEEITFVTASGFESLKPPPKPNVQPVETKILTAAGLKAQIAMRNVDALNSLIRQLRSPLGVIPLVGAGMSAPIRFSDPPDSFPQWGELLLKMAAGTTKEAEIRKLVSAGDYERAAQTIDEHRPGVLAQRIRDAFDREVDRAQLKKGPLSYIPFLARGPIITTNFDHVLEQVFQVAEKPLNPIHGPKPDRIVGAIHQNEPALLKIHGDSRDSTFRVLTVDEYERTYGVSDRSSKTAGTSIGNMAWLMFTNRPLLCLGCSLEKDRTTNVLRALQQQLPGLTHYAILAGHYSLNRWEERDKELDLMGVRPLWYAPGEYGEIEALLREALERSSTRLIYRPPKSVSEAKASVPEPETGIQRFRDLGSLIPTEQDAPGPNQVLLRMITSALLSGNLAFFLGAHAHLGNLPLGDKFYQMLATKFKCPSLAGDRSAVAAFIMSRHGIPELWKEVRSMLSPVPAGPSVLYKMLAALPAFMRATNRAQAAPLWVFTTNYDTMMEEALTAAGERFHLLYYSGGTAQHNVDLFVERAPDGTVRAIECPENLRSVDPEANVIVKFNGGLVHQNAFDESVLINSGHFERLAAAIPAALPLYLRKALRKKSLLFFGHALREPDVDALIRYGAPADRRVKHWAVQLPPGDPDLRPAWDERVEHLRSWGLQIVKCDLGAFLAALYQEWRDTLPVNP